MSPRYALLDRVNTDVNAGKLKINEKERLALKAAVEKALTIAALALPLEVARALPPAEKDALRVALNEVLTDADHKKLVAMWDKKRDPTSEPLGLLRRDNLELLAGDREPYQPITRSLEESKALPRDAALTLRRSIERYAKVADLKKLLGRWDPQFPIPTERKAITARLLQLLDGADLTPAPPPTPKAARRR